MVPHIGYYIGYLGFNKWPKIIIKGLFSKSI